LNNLNLEILLKQFRLCNKEINQSETNSLEISEEMYPEIQLKVLEYFLERIVSKNVINQSFYVESTYDIVDVQARIYSLRSFLTNKTNLSIEHSERFEEIFLYGLKDALKIIHPLIVKNCSNDDIALGLALWKTL
jgi:uncharacterized membrane protein